MTNELNFSEKMDFLKKQGLRYFDAMGGDGESERVILFIRGKNKSGQHVKHLRRHFQSLFCNDCDKRFLCNNASVTCGGVNPELSNFHLTRLVSEEELTSAEWNDVIHMLPCKPRQIKI
jgi:hypothetical protein